MSNWRVRGHGPISELESNLWEVEGEVPGLPMRRRMAVVRLADGSLVVHSAICLDEAAQRRLDVWGAVRYVIVPNGWHRLDAPAYAERYPDARILCPDPTRAVVSKQVRVDGNLSLIPPDPALTCAPLAGTSTHEHVLVVRSSEHTTLVFCDAVFNLPKLPGLKGWAYGVIGSTGAPKVTPLFRMAAVSERRALGSELEALAATPALYRVVPGHGAIVEGASAAPELMRTVAATA